ncbi:MAG: V-type ATP synthase subunit I [Deltaproteobacteria bacterium]|nr:V-type ATP synthase subunit I [Deltaproteobacteria bacterium]
MSIAKMEKVQILTHQDLQEPLVRRIQELEELHITDIRESVTVDEHPDLIGGVEASDDTLEGRLSRIQAALDFLSSLEEKKGFLSGIVSPKVILTPQQYQQIAADYDETRVVSSLRELDRERTELLSEVTKLEGTALQLRPWLSLDSPLEEVTGTEHAALFLGTLPVEALGEMEREASDLEEHMAVEVVDRDRDTAYLLVCAHREVLSGLMELLKRLGFEEVAFPELQGRPRDLYDQALKRIHENRRRIRDIEQTSRSYLKDRQNLQVVYDHLSSQLQRRRVMARFGRTEKVSVIEGWIPRHWLKSFEETLKSEFQEIALTPLEPSGRETPPVVLQNSRTFVRPFEVVTELYGLPNVREYDPSPLLAPFFFVFFGLCITDAAYGVIITLLFLFLMKKFKVTIGRTKLVGLLFFGGISTIIMGAMTGGWFGDLVDYLPSWLSGFRRIREALMLFEPMEQVLVFIGLALVLGFIQISYGLVIRMVRKIREGDLPEAFCGPFPWLILLNGLALFGLSKGGVLPSYWAGLGEWMAILSALAIVLFTDRTSRSWFARIAWGVYGLYGITSYVGDVLSYLRLFALGLATGIIAMVVNLLANMLGGAPYVGWFLFALVFVIGHVFNILINGLGAFVHTLRLQYVEFFPKFFEGGGRPFKPLRREARYTIVTEQNRG